MNGSKKSYQYLLADFHGTIVDSNTAWIRAYLDLGATDIEYVTRLVFQKEKRSIIAEKFGIDYEKLKLKYRENLHIRYEVVEIIKSLPGSQNIIIISNSSREKLLKDMEKIKNEHTLNIIDIYSKEDGNKRDIKFVKKILNKYNINRTYMIGNDIREDFSQCEKITNIIVPYKKTIFYNKSL